MRSTHKRIIRIAWSALVQKPERIADALKACVTKRLREERLVSSDRKIWSRGRSRRYLWKGGHVTAAVDYVLYCKEDVPFEVEGVYGM